MLALTSRLLLSTSGCLLFSGCAICCGPYDHDYLASSHLVQRSDPSYGRVGSVFSDPQAGGGMIMPEVIEPLPTPLGPTENPLPENQNVDPRINPRPNITASAPATSPRKLSSNDARPLRSTSNRLLRDPIRQVGNTRSR